MRQPASQPASQCLTKRLALVLAALFCLAGCRGGSSVPAGTGEPAAIPAANLTETVPAETAEPAETEPLPEPDPTVCFVPADELPETTEIDATVSLPPVAWDGVPLPEARGVVYLPIPSADFDPARLSGLSLLTGDGEEAMLYADAAALEEETVGGYLSENRPVELRAAWNGEVRSLALVFTTLPVIDLERVRIRFSTKPTPGILTLWEPTERGLRVTESAVNVNFRGASSASLAKRGLRLELTDAEGQPNKLSLCGLRRDNDWVLYASYSDNTHVRDALSWKIWADMTANAGLEPAGAVGFRYVEAILEGRYSGFYLLMERMDAKQLGLGEGDSLFKVVSWDTPTWADLKKARASTVSVSSLERKVPDETPAEGLGGWDVLAQFAKLSWESDGATFAAGIEEVVDPRNMIEYWLYVNLIMGADNSWKNVYLAVIDGRVSAYPWDLDITFGLGWNGIMANNFLYENSSAPQSSYDLQTGRRLAKYCPEWKAYAKERWAALKEAGIADSRAIVAQAEEYWDLLHESGAWARNLERWPGTSTTDSLDYLRRMVRQRMTWMESMINGLG